MHPKAEQATLNRYLLLTLICYFSFVIYGSLVPWQYRALPLETALQQFRNISYLNLGINSRADWVANILLFIPLSFLLMSYFMPAERKQLKLNIAIPIALSCVVLALIIEFTQLYFPQRTVSINDIAAESLGALLGIVIFYRFGQQILRYLQAIIAMRGTQNSLLSYLLIAYIALFTLYNILPLDLTLSPVELFKKWQDGRITLLPFSAYQGSFLQIFYAIFSDILLWIPIAVLLYLQQHKKQTIFIRLVLFAALIEFFQLFVYSRVTDITDIILAFIAAWLGYNLGRLMFKQQNSTTTIEQPSSSAITKQQLWLAGVIILYSLVIFLVFWFPYNFDFSWQQINQQLSISRNKVLLESLYFGTEFRAITSLLQKILLFFPLGILFSLSYLKLESKWQKRLMLIFSAGYILLLAAFTEAMQLALPDKTVDITDVLLSVIGAALGFMLTLYCYRFSQQQANPTATLQQQTQATATTTTASTKAPAKHIATTKAQLAGKSKVLFLALHFIVSLVALYGLSQLSALPYNVRELLTDNASAIIGLTLAAYIMFLANCVRLSQFALFVLVSPLLWIVQTSLIFCLLYFSVAAESLYDILGFPNTSLPHFLELLLRFIGFFCLIQFNCLAAKQFLQSKQKVAASILWLGSNIVVASLWYWAVVYLAATDNIVELLDDNGSIISLMALTAWLVLLFLSATYSAKIISQCLFQAAWLKLTKLLLLMFIIVISMALSWWLINIATQSIIVKYQQVFSALQFLLSTDRSHYVTPLQLLIRYCLAYSAILSILTWFYIAAFIASKRFSGSSSY
ncbi:VanZ family protein [Rheinheimera sp. MMS21-TC3]|uniref:VanZ family protein n=1 Tax=Rheinheimera sp. MMS21-TC3 TaxID=3072790 RepID=UPI0028C4A992|nr:VanZ family protein [Rheinheimera sp. MMS21-TC3]WNO60677.1 VanZ family protein [Rheinheimera sp. MMS21-TC3]